MTTGPCRAALVSNQDLDEYDRLVERYDRAVVALERGNAKPLRELESEDDVEDPTPCRAAS